MPIPGILMRPPFSAQPGTLKTALLLHLDGLNGSTTFTDETGKTVTVTGGAVISTAQSKFGGASARIDFNSPSTDRLDIASSTDFAITSAYTAECWARQVTGGGTFVVLQQGTTSSNNVAIRFIFDGSNKPQFRIVPSGVEITGTAVPLGTWVHLAYTRNGSTFTFWQNGVSQGTSITSGFPTESSLAVRIGDDLSGSVAFDGYVDEVRLSKVARYSSGFTPSTSAFELD